MNPFWNNAERRLRSLLRIAIFFILFLLFALGLVFLLSDIVLPRISADSFLLTTRVRNNFLLAESTSPLVALGAVFLAMFLAGRFLDRRPFRDFGFHRNKGWWSDFIFGISLGTLLMLAIFLLEFGLGWIRIKGLFLSKEGIPFWVGMIIDLLIFISVGFYEEMMLRGYLLRNLAEGLNLRWINPRTAVILATLLSSILFGLLHLGNPGMSLVSLLNLILAGIFLSLGFILTGELALPIGLHIAWNYFQGAVFGFPVSGVAGAAPLVTIEQVENSWLTGGVFGPEAGAVGLLAMILGSVLIFAWVKRRRGSVTLQNNLAIYQKPGTAQAVSPPDQNSPG
jgi:uncharacterized protein